MISQDEVDEIGIRVGMVDEIITSYGTGGKVLKNEWNDLRSRGYGAESAVLGAGRH